MRKILLTGSTGYLGKNLLKALLQNGNEVIALVRKESNIDFFENLIGKLIIYRLNEIHLDDIFKAHQFDLIIHTAASYGRKGESLKDIVQANLSFPIEVLDAAIRNNVKYFINTDTALPKSLNLYSHSKKQFLEWLEINAAKINVLNLQLEYFYGPNDDGSKFITFILSELNSGKKEIDFTAATAYRDFIYIDDVVDAYIRLIEQIENVNGLITIPIGSGQAVMLKNIIEEIRAIANHPEVNLNFGALPMRENEIMHSCADISFMESIGWKPKYTFEEGIKETIKIEYNTL